MSEDNPYAELDPVTLARMLRYAAQRLENSPPDLLEVVQPDLAEGALCVVASAEFVEEEVAERDAKDASPQALFCPAPEAA